MTARRDVILLGSTGLDRHPGPRRHRAQPATGSAWSGWPPAAANVAPAGRAGRGVRRAGRRGRRSRCRPALEAALRDGAAAPGARPEVARRPGRRDRAGRPRLRRRAQRHDRLDRAAPRPSPRCAPGTTLALANKESLIVGGPLVTAPPPRARSCRSTPSTPRSRSACAAGRADEVRRLVLTASGGPFRGRTPRGAGRRHARAGAGAPDLGDGPGGHDQLGDPGQQGPRGDRGAPALRRPATTASTSWCTRSRWCTRWSSSSTARRSRRPARRTCGCRSRSALAWPDRVAGRRARRATGRTAHDLDLRARSTTSAFPAVALARARRRAPAARRPRCYNAANEECVAAFLAGRLRVPRDRRHARRGRGGAHAPASGTTRHASRTSSAAEDWARARGPRDR